MNPEADARYWKNLPGQLYIIPLHLPPGTHKIMLAGLKHSDRAGSALFNIEVPHGEKVNVFHLPMMKAGLNYNSAFIEKFKEEFIAAGVSQFGSGWVWLACNQDGELSILTEPNAGNPLTKGYIPILTFDVWEHAYYIDYRNLRADYLNALWKILDWRIIEDRYMFFLE